ncbi:IspD/TarI family cytidylyltransferase [Pontiella sulfatireligans]|uniref:2-C-methyl-D-erythritol 4-phosphate cytidylyltransferase n=1 Tax=Pontiella sulfatireligans TaxID=2750658 RepID=A0A6C2UM17_9BACT|nr:2-C-methyl-D-erythritol 4-phosphate cytidylyltransferase [Pontiella sulfatireligans]VGO20156.1 2-C-methyl-D-erythritol 4-phosphate cytidylyltransferase [Pontiella sulfatireligans]
MNTLAIVIACGKEEEIGSGTEAAFLTLGNGPVLAQSLRTYEESGMVDSVIVVVSKDRVESTMQVVKRFGCTKVIGIVVGGVNRLSSLRTVFSKLPEPASTIIVQEASRPFVSQAVIEETVKAAKRYGCAIAAHRLPDAVKVAPKGLKPEETLDRNTAWVAQTPQVFRSEVLEKIADVKNKGVKLIDDESEWVVKPSEVHLVEAGYRNMKIRSSDDLAMATAILATLRR